MSVKIQRGFYDDKIDGAVLCDRHAQERWADVDADRYRDISGRWCWAPWVCLPCTLCDGGSVPEPIYDAA